MPEDATLPRRVREKFEAWDEGYPEDKLKQWTLDELESKRLLFENEVDRLKVEYKRGRLVDAEMAQVMGKEPLTHAELRNVRFRIENEAEKIRTRFRTAMGHRKMRARRQKQRTIDKLRQFVDSGRNLILAGVMFIRELKGKL